MYVYIYIYTCIYIYIYRLLHRDFFSPCLPPSPSVVYKSELCCVFFLARKTQHISFLYTTPFPPLVCHSSMRSFLRDVGPG